MKTLNNNLIVFCYNLHIITNNLITNLQKIFTCAKLYLLYLYVDLFLNNT